MTHDPEASNEEWYGYRASDIAKIWKKNKLPVIVTEMHLLQELASHYGRRSILSFGLLPPGRSKRTMLSHLLRRLRQRGHDSEEFIRALLKEAERDLQFLAERKDLFDRILVNDNLETVVATLRDHVQNLTQR
jgi:guanylate kinase